MIKSKRVLSYWRHTKVTFCGWTGHTWNINILYHFSQTLVEFKYLNEMFVYRWDIWLVGRWLRWGCQNSKTWTLFSSATRLSTGISRKCSRWKVTRLRQIDRIYRYNFMQLFGQIIKVRTKHSKKLIYEPLFLIDYIYLMYHANNCNYKPTKTQFFCSG